MKTKYSAVSIVLFLAVFSMLASCRTEKTEWQGTTEEVDGVTVIKNPEKPMYSEDIFNLKEDLSIGESEGKEEYLFSRIDGIDVDNNENIYVLNDKTPYIRVFSRSGEFTKTIGRKGQGPGEFQSPRFIQITPQEEVMVFDPATRRLTFFSPDGKYLGHISTAKINYPFAPIKMDPGGNLIAKLVIWPSEGGGVELKKFDSDLKLLTMIYKTRIDEPDKEMEIRAMRPSLYFAISKEGNVIWGNSRSYELEVLNLEGKLIKKIMKDYKPIKITEKDKEIFKLRARRIINRGYELLFPKYFPAFQNISIDCEGRIFVGPYERIESGEDDFYYYDVFDSEGKYIAKIPIKSSPRLWKKGKLYSIEEDEEGYQIVKRYKVNWNI